MKKFKRILSLALVVGLSLIVLVACSKASADNSGSANSPEDTVGSYIDAVTEGNYKKAAGYFENADDFELEESNSLESKLIAALKEKFQIENSNQYDKKLEDIAELWEEKTKPEFDEPQTIGDKSIVTYTLNYPDWSKINPLLDDELSESEEKLDDLKTVLEERDEIYASQEFEVKLTKVDKDWKIVSETMKQD